MYPDATRDLWKNKGSDKEKLLRVVKLVNPNCSVKDEWTKEEEAEEEEEAIGNKLNMFGLCLPILLY